VYEKLIKVRKKNTKKGIIAFSLPDTASPYIIALPLYLHKILLLGNSLQLSPFLLPQGTVGVSHTFLIIRLKPPLIADPDHFFLSLRVVGGNARINGVHSEF
jgi:hypothetical protein